MAVLKIKSLTALPNTDSFSWLNPLGGAWDIASNWMDTTINGTGFSTPSGLNAVSITGGIGDAFTNITGTGSASQLSIAQDVAVWGTVTVAGTLSVVASPSTGSELDVDGGAAVTAAALTIAAGTTLEVAQGSTISASGAILNGGFLLATSNSRAQFGSLTENGASYLYPSTIAVDDSASIEVGSVGGAALGALTIDAGQTSAVSGTIDGNVVLNGTLAVEAGTTLAIDVSDPFGTPQSISGSGKLAISENSQLRLGVADSAAIQFAGPAGTLILSAVPTATISGFTSGDIIQLSPGLATGVTYSQTSPSTAKLTLTKGITQVGTLSLAGNYAGSLFHMRLDASANAFISLQTIGVVPTQPATIAGTSGNDTLIATANNQTLSGLGGIDNVNGGSFSGVVFKDSSAGLNGDTLSSFVPSDTIDLTDMRLATAAVSYTPGISNPNSLPAPGTLVVSDGTRTATIALAVNGPLPVGSWALSSDGASGTNARYTALNTDAYAFTPPLGGQLGQAANWQDTTTTSVATQAPGYGNAVTLAGGTSYIDLLGNGIAASLTTSGADLLLGNLNVGTVVTGVSGALTQTGTLALDGGANLVLTGSASVGGLIEVGGASRMTVAGNVSFSSPSASLLAIDGSVMQFGGVVTSPSTVYPPYLIAVDANSSIEFGSAGGAHTGAVTIDAGVTASLGGSIDGNVVVNGTLSASGRSLVIAPFGTCYAIRYRDRLIGDRFRRHAVTSRFGQRRHPVRWVQRWNAGPRRNLANRYDQRVRKLRHDIADARCDDGSLQPDSQQPRHVDAV